MIPSDQSTFYKFMKDIFLEEWPSAQALRPDQLSRWFIALEFIDLARIKRAFGEYLCDSRQSKYPPKEGQILEIIKTIPFDIRSVGCKWNDCGWNGSERLGDYFYCRNHLDEMILNTEPDSIQAEIIREARKVESEAKELGITNQAYFEKAKPVLFNSIQKMRCVNRAEMAERKIIRAIGDFYETNLGKEEREKIVGRMKNTARYYKLKNEEVAETC